MCQVNNVRRESVRCHTRMFDDSGLLAVPTYTYKYKYVYYDNVKKDFAIYFFEHKYKKKTAEKTPLSIIFSLFLCFFLFEYDYDIVFYIIKLNSPLILTAHQKLCLS